MRKCVPDTNGEMKYELLYSEKEVSGCSEEMALLGLSLLKLVTQLLYVIIIDIQM